MLFLAREGWESFPSLVILCCDRPTKIFLLGLFFAGMLCLSRGKRATQIAQVFGKMLHAHLIRPNDEPKHFFSGQLRGTLWLFGFTSIFAINVLEILLTR
jgi:hypothetical protein